VSRRPIVIFLITVNVIFNLISKLPVHTAYILNVYAKILKASVYTTHRFEEFEIKKRMKEVWSLGFKIINKIITSIGTK
jgi:hypothetical protein